MPRSSACLDEKLLASRLPVMNVALHTPWTVESFLVWEDTQEGRHEFDGIRIYEMTGGSRAHQRIISNLVLMLEDLMLAGLFDAVQEMRIDVGGKIRYPDVSVVTGRIGDNVKTLHDALVLFAVLSDETAATDRHIKRTEYAGLRSLCRYVLFEQDRMAATVFERSASRLIERPLSTDILDVPELRIALPFSGIYKGASV